MRILMLGGTAWLGRAITSAALTQGHQVTCLARGSSGDVPGGAIFVQADRDRADAYQAVEDEQWDVVIDMARQPGHVRRAVKALAATGGRVVLISSGSVYADHGTPGADESAALLPPLADDVMESMAAYGEAKVACEQAVLDGYGPDRSTIVRSGLIGGPGDPTDRAGYWPMRFAFPADPAGSVLIPDSPHQLTQLIDVRDLAAWVVTVAVRGITGTYNATGDPILLADHLDAARGVAGHTGPLVRVDQDWLIAHEVNPWMGGRSLPLWLPMPDYAGFGARDNAAARAAGLPTRPLDETLGDILAWETRAGVDRPRKAGLTTAEERELIEAAAAHRV
jgi:2'-hydroxyisoflavone reductase